MSRAIFKPHAPTHWTLKVENKRVLLNSVYHVPFTMNSEMYYIINSIYRSLTMLFFFSQINPVYIGASPFKLLVCQHTGQKYRKI